MQVLGPLWGGALAEGGLGERKTQYHLEHHAFFLTPFLAFQWPSSVERASVRSVPRRPFTTVHRCGDRVQLSAGVFSSFAFSCACLPLSP